MSMLDYDIDCTMHQTEDFTSHPRKFIIRLRHNYTSAIQLYVIQNISKFITIFIMLIRHNKQNNGYIILLLTKQDKIGRSNLITRVYGRGGSVQLTS